MMRGQEICRKHGAKAPQNLAAAKRRLTVAAAEADARALLAHEGVPDATDVAAELGRLASEVAAMRGALGQRVNSLRSVTDTEGRLAVEIGMYERALDRSLRVLDVAGRLRLGERQVELDAERLQLVRVALARGIAAAELDAAQRVTLLRVFAAEVRAQGRLEIEEGSKGDG